jgi:UDP-2-acetamido-3-amino-2,3-dideoxy-glucuronate N-acetyltransferase
MNSSITDSDIGPKTRCVAPVNIYGAKIGHSCLIGPFTEIQRDVTIGNNVKVESHTFICSGVSIQDDVFIGHGVMFVNDTYPRAGRRPRVYEKTVVEKGASIGSGATILPVVIGEGAMVGAGSVVTKDVPRGAVVAGNPARVLRILQE